MRILLIIGLRNLARRKWRTFATALMLFIGTLLLVFLTGIAEGSYAAMIRLGTRTFNGDFQVLHSDYHEKPSLFKNIADYQATADALRRDARVAGVAFRVEAPGLLAYEHNTMGGLLLGIDPRTEVCTFINTVSAGAWWTEVRGDTLPVVLGKGIAARLKVALGDEITFVGQGADGSIAAELFTLVGITDSGIDELDRAVGYIPLDVAQELLVMEGRVHRIVGRLHDLDQSRAFAAAHPQQGPLVLSTWDTLLPQLANTIDQDRKGGLVFLFIILMVVLISVANTMLMSVMERTYEFGVIAALGTTPRMLTLIVLAEIFFLSLLGMLPAVGIGMALNVAFAERGIPMGLENLSYGGVTLNRMFTINTLEGNLIYPLLVLGGALIAGLLPALRAARLKPVDAIRD